MWCSVYAGRIYEFMTWRETNNDTLVLLNTDDIFGVIFRLLCKAVSAIAHEVTRSL